jgi:hypothetical protein
MSTKQKSSKLSENLTERLDSLNMHYLDKLSIHLVAADIKPSSLILLKRDYEHAQIIMDGLKMQGFYITTLDRSSCNFFELIVTADNSKCERLNAAILANDKYNIGIMLGYPENAILSFTNKLPGRIHSYQQMLNICVFNGLNKGKNMPNFFAYLLHIPENIIIDKDVITVDSQSEALSKKYMKYIRSVDPNLSNETERKFIDELYNGISFSGNIYSNGEFYSNSELFSIVR